MLGNTISDFAKYACENYAGDLLEIGIGYGHTAKELLPIAKEYERKLIGIDPFETGWDSMPQSYQYAYDEFLRNMGGKLDESFIVYKENSLSSIAETYCSLPLCFAFVDGLQYKGAVLSDLNIVSHAGIIVVDDFDRENYKSEVPSAIRTYMKNNPHKQLIDKGRWAIIV